MTRHRDRSRGLTACAALVLATLAPGAEAQDGDDPQTVRACLNHPTIRRTKILGDRNIVFVTRDDKIYNNTLPRQCPSLGRNSLVNYTVENSRLCAGSRFTVLWQHGPNPTDYVPAFVCQLGNFVPITEDELADLTAMMAPERERRGSRRASRDTITTREVKLPRETPAASAPEPASAH
jgi:hypothetical protein